MTKRELVIFVRSFGTVFEWRGFYLYPPLPDVRAACRETTEPEDKALK